MLIGLGGERLELPADPRDMATLIDLSEAARAGETTLQFPPFEPPVLTAPGVWNLEGDAHFAREWPLSWDYLDERSPNYALKRFQRAIYLDRLAPRLEHLFPGAHVLDLGGGIGRFSTEWLRREYRVTHCDPNADALTIALGHLARVGGRFELFHLAAESLAPLPDDHFHAVSAMEVFCYLSEPEAGMAEAARVLRPGGQLFCSVESAHGAGVGGDREHAVEGDVWVRYFTPVQLVMALEGAGLDVVEVVGVHYLGDGPLHHVLDFDRLGDPEYDASLVDLDRRLSATEKWGGTARAWLAVARKPE